MNTSRVHWLAGILEGEGSFIKGPPSRPNTPAISVSMCDRDVLERAAHTLGIKRIHVRRPRAEHHRIAFQAKVRGSTAIRWMLTLRPVLSCRRQAQIDVALESAAQRMRRPVATLRPMLALAPKELASPLGAKAWLAGILEAEGSFGGRHPSRSSSPRIGIEMTDRDTIERVARLFGGSSIQATRRPDHSNWSPTFRTQLNGRKAARLMLELRPLLGERRKRQVDGVLREYAPQRLSPGQDGCVVVNCPHPHRSRGLCHTHYMAWSRASAARRPTAIIPLR